MSEIHATIERVKFYNAENFYAVLLCEDGMNAIGTVPNPAKGMSYIFTGDWVTHPKFGRQFSVQESELILPDSEERIREFLSAGAVRGIGPVKANRIVDVFKEDSLRIIEHEPEELLKVNGIGKKSLSIIKEGWREAQQLRELQKFLQKLGSPSNLAIKIYKVYKNESVKVISKNPYVLTKDIVGLTFKAADSIALALGFGLEHPERLKYGIIYYLKRSANGGHCYEESGCLAMECAKTLQVSTDKIAQRIAKMVEEEDSIIVDSNAVYLKSYFFSEMIIAKKLYEVSQYEGYQVRADIHKLETEFGIEYDGVQIDAINAAVKNKVSVITGGPGTGKTTIIKAVVKAYEDSGKEVILASPTGRAAKRMSEVTGKEAKTIHRMLEYSPADGKFHKNNENPLDGDILIMDECSMIDILLMGHLLKAVPPHMNIIMVGDADQLPSVGPGNVLSDIINSERFHVVRLEKIYRQAEESDIVMNAHRINRGMGIALRGRDVIFIETKDIRSELLKIAKKEKDLQVLSPMKKGENGTVELNSALQNIITPGKEVAKKSPYEYRIGDRVMQIRNNYDKEVYNGSLGTVKAYDSENKILTVDFGGTPICYESAEMDEIMLSYAITIHKSQGSEFPVVAIPLTVEHRVMLQRNLLYTAFTRPSEKLYLVGDMKAADMAIRNFGAKKRRTRLIERIRSWFDK